jgi:hypothetical protein
MLVVEFLFVRVFGWPVPLPPASADWAPAAFIAWLMVHGRRAWVGAAVRLVSIHPHR